MAKIQRGAYPHIHSGSSTHSYMFDLPITTYPMAVVAIIFQFLYSTIVLNLSFSSGIEVAIRAALVIFVAVGSCLLAESLWWRFVDKKYEGFAGWFRIMATTYPSITGMLYALALPINTPLYVVFIGGFVAIILGKTIFGGVGQNIFNPALVGRAFVTIAWADLLSQKATDYVSFIPDHQIADGYSSASPLAHLASETAGYLPTLSQIIDQFGSFWNILLGFYPSALGEGLSWWIILAAIYLAFRKTINWYVPTIYVGLVFLMSWAVALISGLGGFDSNGLEFLAIYYPLFQVLTGGLLFGAVFMATEPVTSPMTRRGKIIFATYLAIITFAIRMLGGYPEGVLFSILIMNMFVPLIDGAFASQNRGIRVKEWIFYGFTIALIIGLVFYVTTTVGGVA
ncbi:RnfABCDGE type electron transport complex subunit D [Haloplasma contractile]|uniref:Electron transport complex RnfABCDGE type D subunit protein n=1 Tax=Haloplasma contractile SSD-17B TaxID=1033810 RepID=U2FSC2_9MOLU|nr:RnfABCDGE type electron transport complex subunit D [Haloplasma contractile]ERJ13839.1 Electron transport complex RnfABCDGE type D subunit protein [Haloplasma contractile SSD-17B]